MATTVKTIIATRTAMTTTAATLYGTIFPIPPDPTPPARLYGIISDPTLADTIHAALLYGISPLPIN